MFPPVTWQVLAEKEALSCEPHPCIIGLYGTFSDEQNLYFAMELAIGGELFALIEEMDVLPEAAVKYYSAAVGLALGHLHQQRFIYRDLKPENVLLDVQGHLKLCDLGLAKRSEHTFTVVGTPQYLCPEVLKGEGATRAADWWALGVLIFEMLNGELPFNSADGTDRSLFTAIKLGAFSWPLDLSRFTHNDRSNVPTARVRDIVAGLTRQAVPAPAAQDGMGSPCKSDLLAPGQPIRLGSGPGDIDEVRGHIWFHNFDFDALLKGEYPPPYVPKLTGTDDDANFGPLDWRGEPIVRAPDYDTSKWDMVWADW